MSAEIKRHGETVVIDVNVSCQNLGACETVLLKRIISEALDLFCDVVNLESVGE